MAEERLKAENLLRNLRTLMDRSDSALGASAEALDGNLHLRQRIAHQTPLSHATGRDTLLAILLQGGLLSGPGQVDRGLLRPESGPPSVEAILGTEDAIFTYTAPFRYPETSCGLLFKVALEQSRSSDAVATPFDSGSTIRHLRPRDSQEEQIDFVRSHELPVPHYRVALERLLRHFASAWDYIDGTDPFPSWPIPVEGGDWRRWTFEVRFRDMIQLNGSLLAAFLPVAVASHPRVAPKIARWRQVGVEVRYLRTPRTDDWRALRRMSIEYIRELLG